MVSPAPVVDLRAHPMHTLPRLRTPQGEFDLPLAEPTAERLADAFLTNDPQRRRDLLRAAVAGDPAFAVWGLAQAHLQGLDDCKTAAALAEWLAEQPVKFFRPSLASTSGSASNGDASLESSLLEDFAEPAGASLAVALLAAEFAATAGADPEQTYLNGLVHLAAAWLIEAAVVPPLAPPGLALPAWISDAVLETQLAPQRQSMATRCLTQAMGLVSSTHVDEWRAMGCDARAWIGRWAVLGEQWGRSGPWTARFAALVERMTAHEQLAAEFDRALEFAKLEAMKELAYGAGHEINNPLANISARAQTLLREETDPERRRALASINTQAFRAHEMIADMMLFARPPQPKFEPCDLGKILRTLVAELAPIAEQQHVRLALQLPANTIEIAAVEISADSTQVAVAVRSLLVNALEALVTGGLVEISLTPASERDPWVRIAVADNGPGIPAEMRSKIFEPFFSGREAGRGLGLGLSKCWRLVTLHGGRVEFEDRAGGGVQFIVVLPVSRES